MVSVPKMRHLEKVNKELWLVLSMFIIALLMNFIVDAQRMMLSFYTLPTLGSAYLYGRRHATFTAFGSVLLVILLTATTPMLGHTSGVPLATWLDLSAWAGTLIVTRAGALVTDRAGHNPTFNQPTPQTNGLLTAHAALHQGLLAALA